jgi:TonB-dependent SusC/RagA subfamily outer membrane receptor
MWGTTTAAALCTALALLPGCGRTATPAPGATPRDKVTGAVETLPDSTLAGQHVESIVELLQGRVAGLEVTTQPNGDISLRIRGGDVSLLGSRAGPREPLLVIDGMAVSSSNVTRALRSLRPHEIANIEVLKDVSSTSVYGTRGAHGVIVITTKRD